MVSCEDVVEVNVPADRPRLIIDALIRVDESNPNIVPVIVKVTESSSFFGESPVTDLKQITFGQAILNQQQPGTGIYEGRVNFESISQGLLILQVEHRDQRYLAWTSYSPGSAISSLEYVADGDKDIVKVKFQDPDTTNFYVFDMGFGEFATVSDEFFQGELHEFSYEYNRDLTEGESLTISLLGADQEFYNYMNVLINQALESTSPFDTPVSTARGNIINVTEIDNIDFFDNVFQTDNFALGYFAVVSSSSANILVNRP